LARYAGFGKDCLNRAFRNARFTIDAICWVDIDHLVIHVEAFHRANSYTISVFAVIAGLGYNMSHRKIPFPNYHGQISYAFHANYYLLIVVYTNYFQIN
jgi:hypothetical protein